MQVRSRRWDISIRPGSQAYSYAQVEKIDNRLHIIGQMSHDTAGNLVGPAPTN